LSLLHGLVVLRFKTSAYSNVFPLSLGDDEVEYKGPPFVMVYSVDGQTSQAFVLIKSMREQDLTRDAEKP